MSERYYLLRNNRESGPFSLDELLQQCLLPGDLLWVEGRSQNWMTPGELPEVQRALPKGYSLSPAESKVFDHVSDREQALRAEGLRRRALAALYQQQAPVHLGTPRPDMPAASYAFSDPEDLEVVHHKPEKARGALPEFFLFCTLSALVVLGWRGGIFAHLIQVRPQGGEVASQQMTSESAHAAAALSLLPQPSVPGTMLPAATADTLQHRDSSLLVATPPVHRSAPLRSVAGTPVNPTESTTVAAPPVATVTAPANNPEPRRETAAATPQSTNGTAAAPKEKEDKPAPQPAAKPAVVAQAPEAPKEEVTEKKHGFLRGLFGRKKKKEEAPAEAGGK